jgi:lysozyme
MQRLSPARFFDWADDHEYLAALAALACLAVIFALAILLSGCGKTPPTQTVTAPGSVPAKSISVRPESARTPEGAKGALVTRAILGRLPSALTGSGIRIDGAGAALIERFEEVQKAVYCPYWDAYGHVWTRGFGETDWGGNFGGRCVSHSQAVANLVYLVNAQYLPAVRNLGVNFNHHQIDALASFVWNLGAGIFTGSLRFSIQHHNPYPMLAYDRAGGVVLSGLASRRRAEVALFLRPEVEPKPETPAQRRAREERELRGHEHVLDQLRTRQKVLRRALAHKGCYPRLKTHRAGLRCRRWKAEGDSVSAHGKFEDGKIAQLKRELGR